MRKIRLSDMVEYEMLENENKTIFALLQIKYAKRSRVRKAEE